MSDPRKINLNLPADYIDKPAGKVRDWLKANTASIRMLDESAIIARLRTTLGPQIAQLNDGDLSSLVAEWATANGVATSPIPPRAAPGEPEIVAQLKKTFGAIPTSIKFNRKNVGGEVTVSGATAYMKTGPLKHSATRSWGGDFEFKTQAPGVAFTVALGEKDWRLMMAFGKLAPDLSDMASVFKKGEAALRGALSNIDRLDLRNPSKSKQVLAPYLDPIKSAVTSASRSAKMQAGDLSLGAWVGSGPTGGIAGGAQLTIVF